MATDPQARLRLALIGLGNQGQEHLLGMASSRHTTFVAGVDPSEASRQRTRQQYPDLELFDGIEQLNSHAERLRLDGLVLCLPHHSYQDAWPGIAAMQLPVLKEKPLARTVDEARQLVAQLPGQRLKTAIQRRHHASYQQLRHQLREDDARIQQVHTWLHLGRAHDPARADWRSKADNAGGGILLDAGYHLIDLVHFLVGPVELVYCTTWGPQGQSAPGTIENDALLLARNTQCWVMVDARLGGEPDSKGMPQKSEGILLATDRGQYRADRSAIHRDGQLLWQGERDWQQAMGRQLDEFADDIRQDRWDTSSYWDQLPAMQLIESAYQVARRY